MESTYCCPNCNEDNVTKFTKHYDAYMKVDESRVYSLDELESSEPEPDWSTCESERGDNETDISEEFSHFNCGSCGHNFDSFHEVEPDEDEEEEEDEQTVAADLTNINTPTQKSLRRQLTDLLGDDELVVPSHLVAKIQQALDSNAADEVLEKLLELIREL